MVVLNFELQTNGVKIQQKGIRLSFAQKKVAFYCQQITYIYLLTPYISYNKSKIMSRKVENQYKKPVNKQIPRFREALPFVFVFCRFFQTRRRRKRATRRSRPHFIVYDYITSQIKLQACGYKLLIKYFLSAWLH